MNETEFYLVARTVLVKRATDYQKYDALFNLYWHGETQIGQPSSITPAYNSTFDFGNIRTPSAEEGQSEPAASFVIYSPLEARRFRHFDSTIRLDWRQQRRAIRLVSRYFASRPGRRFRQARHGQIDTKKTIRSNMVHAGEFLKIVRRYRRHTRTKFLVLCDISGSMEGHTTSLMLTLGNLCRSHVATEIFAFSTHLVRLTDHFRYLPREIALKTLSERLDLWGSGTKIGHCLKLFNARFPSLVDERTVLVIISDGWDVGEIEVLREELAKLRKKSRVILWLNPLAEQPDFEPATAGMTAALDYIDLLSTPEILNDIGKLRRSLGNTIMIPRIANTKHTYLRPAN